MEMKERFKKALFAFFKDEIIESVGYSGQSNHVKIVSKEMNFTQITSEIVLDERGEQIRRGEPISISYERALEDCKQKLFKESMKYIHVDEQSLMDSHIYDGRIIRVSLFIGQTER